MIDFSSLEGLNISKQATTLNYTSQNGVYDYDFSVKAYQVGNLSLTFAGNTTINSSSFGVVYSDSYKTPQSNVLGVGLISVGSLLRSNLTNYLGNLLKNGSQIVLCTRLIAFLSFDSIKLLQLI